MKLENPQSVIVIGAGIIGVLSALQLQREGHVVTLVDKELPGSGCSFGNAGILARSSFAPLSSPSSLLQAPAWLLNPRGPLSIRWGYILKMLPWLMAYLAAGFRKDYSARGEALKALTANSLRQYQVLAQLAECEELIEKTDYMQVYRSVKAREKSDSDIRWRQEMGFKIDLLNAADIQRLEPALSDKFISGFLIRDHGYVKDPQALVSALFHCFKSLGGQFVQGSVTSIKERDQDCQIVIGNQQYSCDKLVIAAGAFSARLIALTGVSIPLEAERGYHVSSSSPKVKISRPMMDGDRKFFITPMSKGYRAAGMVEFAGLDAKPSQNRLEVLQQSAEDMLPGLDTSDASHWLGFRPTLTDSMPVISTAPNNARIIYAFGHQHLGLTCAPATAEIVADLIAQRPSKLDISAFDAARF